MTADLSNDAEVDPQPLRRRLVSRAPSEPVRHVDTTVALGTASVPLGRVDRRRRHLPVADLTRYHAYWRHLMASCAHEAQQVVIGANKHHVKQANFKKIVMPRTAYGALFVAVLIDLWWPWFLSFWPLNMFTGYPCMGFHPAFARWCALAIVCTTMSVNVIYI